MNARRTLLVARKEVTHVLRDPRSLFLVLLMPLAQMMFLGYGVNLDAKHIPLCIFDREGSQASRTLLSWFGASEYFSVVNVLRTYDESVAALDAGRCRMALVIPADFSREVNDKGKTSVQALVDATDDNHANLAIVYARAVLATYSEKLRLDYLGRRGFAHQLGPILTVETRTWFNEELENRNLVVPGVMVIVMAMVGALLTSLTIAREWEVGTMEQLISTPIKPMEIALGKLIPYFAIGLLDTALCAEIGVYWFNVPMRGSIVTLTLASSLFLVVALGSGFLYSAVTKSQFGATLVALLMTYMPSLLLSGFAFPISQMPFAVRFVTYFVPARYYVTILKGIFLKGVGLKSLAVPTLVLGLYAIVVMVQVTAILRKTVD
jgi:ABC-2 type transport system permease protein